MVNTGFVFMASLLAFYNAYRLIIKQDDLYEIITWLHLVWQTLYLGITVTIIYAATSVTGEVR